MKLKKAFLGLTLFVIAGCGDLLGDQTYKLESGTYAVSSATLASTNDECGLLGAYTAAGKAIGITVNNDTVTFNLANDPAVPSAELPTALLDSNALTELAEANYTVNWGDVCVTRVRRDVVGSVTADNTAELTLSFNVSTEAGTCNSSTSGFAAVPCASAYHFIATKQ